jgi:hypothetical protein
LRRGDAVLLGLVQRRHLRGRLHPVDALISARAVGLHEARWHVSRYSQASKPGRNRVRVTRTVMQALTAAANQAIASLSNRYGVSEDAVRTLLFAVSAGGGTMAQFYHVDLGGGGQWMRGGMTMVGDMFNSGLKSRVDGICSELSSLLATQTVFAPLPQAESSGGGYGGYSTNSWWPAELGSPSSSGGQNDSQYAYFPGSARLAVKQGGHVAIYDTLDHQIGGVQQQQGGSSGSFSFSSQRGTFSVDSLPFAPESPGYLPPSPPYYAPQSGGPAPGYEQSGYAQSTGYAQAPGYSPSPEPSYSQPSNTSPRAGRSPEEILAAIERLGDLHRKGLLSDSEFQTKKADLLAQL